MKKISYLFLFQSITLAAQVSIGTENPDPSAVLELNGSSQGLLLPRVPDYKQIKNAPAGLVVYNTGNDSIYFSDGSHWKNIFAPAICQNTNGGNTCTPSEYELKDKKLAYERAKKFAPILKFDRDAYNFYYPTSLKNILTYSDPSTIRCGGDLKLKDKHKETHLNFPTYYGVQEHPYKPNRIFIDYWLAYVYQPPCKLLVTTGGSHDYDWEHLVVQADKTTDKVYSVTYYQHSGWYTRKWSSIEKEGTHPVAYIAKIAHGMYYDKLNSTSDTYSSDFTCLYYGDHRDPVDSTIVKSENNLRAMSCYLYGFQFNGKYGEQKNPLYRGGRDYWDYTTCKGTGYAGEMTRRMVRNSKQCKKVFSGSSFEKKFTHPLRKSSWKDVKGGCFKTVTTSILALDDYLAAKAEDIFKDRFIKHYTEGCKCDDFGGNEFIGHIPDN